MLAQLCASSQASQAEAQAFGQGLTAQRSRDEAKPFPELVLQRVIPAFPAAAPG